MKRAAANILTRDVKVLERAASIKVNFSVEEDKGTVLTGKKLSIMLSSISKNKSLKKVERGLGTIAASSKTKIGEIKVSRIEVDGINVNEINKDKINIGGTDGNRINVDGTNIGGTNIGGTNVNGTDIGETNIGETNIGGIKVGEVKTYGIGVYEAKVYEVKIGAAKVYIVLKEPSFLFFSTPFIIFSSYFSSSFRAFYFKVRFVVFSFSRRFVALLYFFFFTKFSPSKATAIAGQL